MKYKAKEDVIVEGIFRHCDGEFETEEKQFKLVPKGGVYEDYSCTYAYGSSSSHTWASSSNLVEETSEEENSFILTAKWNEEEKKLFSKTAKRVLF